MSGVFRWSHALATDRAPGTRPFGAVSRCRGSIGAERPSRQPDHAQNPVSDAVLSDWTSATRRVIVAVFWRSGTVPVCPPPTQLTDHDAVATTVKASSGWLADEDV